MIGNDDVVTPGSTIPMTIVGAGGRERGLGLSSLACFTPSASTAVWLLPDGNIVPPQTQASFTAPPNTLQSRDQGSSITLHRGDGFITPPGQYCCGSATNVNERLCVTLASCPLLALDNGVVTYTDPPVDNAHNSITANHTCFDGHQLAGDSIRICDISGGTGIWRGEHRSCKGPVYLSLGTVNPVITTNNTDIRITAIGDDVDGLPVLTCHTDLMACCRTGETGTVDMGKWYNPNGDSLSNNSGEGDFYIRRNDAQLIRLNRRSSVAATSPLGLYCCVIPTSIGEQIFCANLVLCSLLTAPTNGGISYSDDKKGMGTVATYSCDAGYVLVGDLTRTCDSADAWSGTEPTCERPVYLSLGTVNPVITANNTDILITDIGEDFRGHNPTLTCHTDLKACCRSFDHGGTEGLGNWFNPNGDMLLSNAGGGDFYIRRNDPQLIRLNRRSSVAATSPVGLYCCVIPTSFGEQIFCANLVLCNLLTAPTNGGIFYSDDKRGMGTVATYSCDAGYGLVGDLTRVCDSADTWTGTEPSCEERVKFMHHGQTYLNNSIVAINDIGEGDSALLCVTDKHDCCKPPNGLLQGEFYFPNNSMVRNEASGDPLYINRGPQVVRFNKRSNAHPPAGIYRCDVPESTGLTISIYINITDIVIDCGALPNPANGQVNTSSGTTLNRFATYSCYTGYVRTGYSRRVCRADGRWNSTTPTCVIVDCGLPPNPPHGDVDTSSGTVFNSLAMYSCDVGYILDGNSLSVCGPDGMWGRGTPSCLIVDCGPLHDPGHGMVDTSRGTTYNSRATYACDRGYIRNGTDSRICQPDGMWSAIEPVCNPVDCGALHNPENGIVDTSAWTTLGHNATYRCNTGYRHRGSMFRTCNADGIWTPSQPSCDPVDCDPLPHPENGGVNTSSGTTFQKVSHYSCYVGYTLSGAMTRVCSENGQWIPDAPYCPIVDCGPLLNPENGRVDTTSGTTYNRVAFYTCIEGYELVGEPVRHCDPDGMWRPSAPSCVPVDCGPLRQPKNGIVNTIPDTYLNSTATYSCNPGYNLTGNTQRVCQSNGSWSSSAPYCADSAMVQVKFGPTSHCVEWSESRVELMYKMLRESIFKAIVEKGGQPIAVDKINKGYFSCYSSNTRTTYRTTISGLENTSAVHLAELVQKWVESGVSMRALWYVIKIDKSCPVLVSSIDDDECA